MLPGLDRLAIVPTRGNLRNAQWPDGEVGGDLRNAKWSNDDICSICLHPLGAPSLDPRYPWPFPDEGADFTAVACVNGDVFHKGCLRFMKRFGDTKCPDCRAPILAEVLADVSRPSPEDLERRRQQAEKRARERAQFEERKQRAKEAREARERELYEYEAAPDSDNEVIQWACFFKGKVPRRRDIWNTVRSYFDLRMRQELPEFSSDRRMGNWGLRLGIELRHGTFAPRDYPDQTDEMEVSLCRFRLHVPSRVAGAFASYLLSSIGRRGYTAAMRWVLGLEYAKQSGEAVVHVPAIFEDAQTPTTVALLRTQERANFVMSYQEYNEWLPFAYTNRP